MSNKNLNIVLLCAGKSSRLKFNLPKVILPINGRTLIERSLENLDKLNPKKIIIVTGFRDDLVTNLVKTFRYKNIKFVRGDIFTKNFKDKSFDFIWCNGVLHHTKDPYEAFKCIIPSLKKNGYILLGLYNKFGRFRTKFRKYVYKFFGKKIIVKLDPVLRNIPNKNQDKINAWIKDQYIHPVESTHTFDEVLKWFEVNNIEFVNSVPESSPFNNTQKNLFEMNSKATFVERILQQLAMIFTSFGSEGGLFLFIGKKKN